MTFLWKSVPAAEKRNQTTSLTSANTAERRTVETAVTSAASVTLFCVLRVACDVLLIETRSYARSVLIGVLDAVLCFARNVCLPAATATRTYAEIVLSNTTPLQTLRIRIKPNTVLCA